MHYQSLLHFQLYLLYLLGHIYKSQLIDKNYLKIVSVLA